MKRYVDQRLQKLDKFSGSVGAVQITLSKGEYSLFNLRLLKSDANIPVPFFSADRLDLTIDWRELLRGDIAGTVLLQGAELNFVNGPSEQQKQTGIKAGWADTLDSLHPFTIDRFVLRDGVIRYSDPHRSPRVDVFVTNVVATATNLTNIRTEDSQLPAALFASGLTTGGGVLKLELRLDPLAKPPTFKLAASVTGLELPALNDFLRSYASVDAESGRFWMFLNVAAADGRYRGVAKPFFINASTVDSEEFEQQSLLQSFWESLVGGAANLLENQSTDRLATRVPIEGTFPSGTDIDLWSTIGGILRNAFLQALQPGIPRPVELPRSKETRS